MARLGGYYVDDYFAHPDPSVERICECDTKSLLESERVVPLPASDCYAALDLDLTPAELSYLDGSTDSG